MRSFGNFGTFFKRTASAATLDPIDCVCQESARQACRYGAVDRARQHCARKPTTSSPVRPRASSGCSLGWSTTSSGHQVFAPRHLYDCPAHTPLWGLSCYVSQANWTCSNDARQSSDHLACQLGTNPSSTLRQTHAVYHACTMHTPATRVQGLKAQCAKTHEDTAHLTVSFQRPQPRCPSPSECPGENCICQNSCALP